MPCCCVKKARAPCRLQAVPNMQLIVLLPFVHACRFVVAEDDRSRVAAESDTANRLLADQRVGPDRVKSKNPGCPAIPPPCHHSRSESAESHESQRFFEVSEHFRAV